MMTPTTYRHLLSLARRHAPRADLASDLLHDALLVAARDGVDLEEDAGQRWIGGVLRNVSRHQARTDQRRRKREATSSASADAEADLNMGGREPQSWQALPPASRRVVALALHGMGKREICAALGLSDAAFRQRLAVARRVLGQLPEDLLADTLARAQDRRRQRGDDVPLGLLRRALLRSLRSQSSVGTHDLDGHLVIVGR